MSIVYDDIRERKFPKKGEEEKKLKQRTKKWEHNVVHKIINAYILRAN